MRCRPPLGSLLITLLAAATAGADDLDPKDREFFEAKVRPVLVERCYECHAAGSKSVRGGLLLDTKAGLLEGGDTGPSIEPGDPEASPLIQALRYDDPVLKMPPKGRLPEAEVEALAEWVRRGAPDPRTGPAEAPAAEKGIDLEAGRRHWAFQPLKAVEPPAVRDEFRVRNPIDRFVLARLDAAGLEPTPEPDRRTLIRRAYFGLIGLPPTPEQLEAHLADPGDGWYDRMVDGLLESPHLGERWARHWLDLARFAESHGFEHDYDRPTAYPYRDFVIAAFNDDLPFDAFVKWQLAGDEYAPDDPEALKATGFLAAGVHSTQITASQVEKERYDELDDIVNTAGTAFLGLTLGCARCHDHKFDPIPVEDYYRLVATFTTTVRSEVELPRDAGRHARALARFEAEHAPYVAAQEREERERLPARLARWERTRGEASGEVRWVVLEPGAVKSAGGATFARQEDGSFLASGPNPEFDTYTIEAPCHLAEITAIKVEALADPSLPHGGPGRAGNGNFALTDAALKVGPLYGIGRTFGPRLVHPKATFEQAGLPVAAAVDDEAKSGWAVDPEFGRDHAAVFELGEDVRADAGSTLSLTLKFENNAGHNIGRVRLSVTDAARPVGLGDDGLPADVRAILALDAADRTAEQVAALLAWYRTIDPGWRARKKALDDHAAAAPRAEGVKALVGTEGLPAVRLHTQGGDHLEATHLLRRGDPGQKVRAVEPGFLQVLLDGPGSESAWGVSPPEGWRTSYRRRALAEWMTDAERGAGHLLARVIVNRLWQHHMGRGIVATPSDFGTQGGPPTYPELLDWLASELIRGGWRLKPIHKLILSSATYRQGSAIDEAKAAVDVENALRWRQERRRLEAEPIRDAMLHASGLLDPRMFGPGSLDERMRRRSVYFTVKRSKLIPMMTLFDGPDGVTPLADRPTTTVAPQSLLLLNSPVVREWAVAFAERVRPDEAVPSAEAIDRAYLLALSRPPTGRERAEALAFVDRQAAAHRAAGREEGAALADFCQVLMGLNEFVFIE